MFDKNKILIWLLVHVDDIMMTETNKSQRFIVELNNKFL